MIIFFGGGMGMLKSKFALNTLRARSMYGCTDLFTKIRKNVRKWDYVHPYITIFQDFGIFEKSVHFHRDYLTK